MIFCTERRIGEADRLLEDQGSRKVSRETMWFLFYLRKLKKSPESSQIFDILTLTDQEMPLFT